MTDMNMIQAINSALDVEMRRDENVVVFGEDVGKFGGVFRATDGLQDSFGEDRVFDTPLSEGGIIGAAIGMAMYGLRPVSEIQFVDFIFPGFDQIVNEAAKLRYRSGGQYHCPLVIRTPYGGGIRGGHYHSQSPEALFLHTPGLKVAVPSNPHDAKGMLIAAIRDEDPVLILEPKRIYRASRGEVAEQAYEVPLGEAAVVRSGKDVTILAWGAVLYDCKPAVEAAAADGIDCELIDLRTLAPLDVEAILRSVRKTGRCVIVHEAPKTAGFGGELAAIIQERALSSLQAPVQRVTGYDTPFPYALENEYMPSPARIRQGIDKALHYDFEDA